MQLTGTMRLIMGHLLQRSSAGKPGQSHTGIANALRLPREFVTVRLKDLQDIGAVVAGATTSNRTVYRASDGAQAGAMVGYEIGLAAPRPRKKRKS